MDTLSSDGSAPRRGTRTATLAVVLALLSACAGSRADAVGIEGGSGSIEGFEPNYLLVGADSLDSNAGAGDGDCDVKFQLSFSRRLSAPRALRGGVVGRAFGRDSPLYFGFTQRAWWDICRHSAPFRETNYAPSLFYRGAVPFAGERAELLAGYVHQSNGESDEGSRRWERLFARLRLPLGERVARLGFDTADRRRWLVDLTLWYPFLLAEENRDITRFAGYGELAVAYTPNAESRLRLTLRKGGGLTRWARGLAELDYVFPIPGTGVQGLLQYTNGYGASLGRFDRHEYALRVGVLFSDFDVPSRR